MERAWRVTRSHILHCRAERAPMHQAAFFPAAELPQWRELSGCTVQPFLSKMCMQCGHVLLGSTTRPSCMHHCTGSCSKICALHSLQRGNGRAERAFDGVASVFCCHVMSCHVMSCHVMSCHVMSCHVMSCHVMSCHVMSCHVMSCHVMSCHVMSCHVMSCHVMSCHVMSCPRAGNV